MITIQEYISMLALYFCIDRCQMIGKDIDEDGENEEKIESEHLL